MMDTIRPLPVILTVQVVNKLFEEGHYESPGCSKSSF